MMNMEFTQAVRTLVTELNREAASGLISRKALIAMDRVQRLLEAETALRAMVAHDRAATADNRGASA